MPDYRQFDSEMLAADASFRRWQLADDPVDGALWREWLRQNPDRAEPVEKAAWLLKTIHGTYQQRFAEDVPLSDREIQDEIQRLHEALQEPGVRRGRWFRLTPVRYGIAASLLLVLSLFGWYAFRPVNVKSADPYGELVNQATSPLSEIVNTTSQLRHIDLPDRSTITLYPNSRVSYEERFAGNKREVFLSGKAQFTVTKNAARPFYVYANGLTTKVLGTQFTVQAYADATDVKVVVRSGKVAVFGPNRAALADPSRPSSAAGVVLTPNQQLVFSSTETRLVKRLVEQPVPLEPSAQQKALRFRRTPIAEVFTALSRSYGITIVFDADVMRDCQLTASLTDEPLFEQLDLICHTINARYEQVNGEIIIHSKGCE